MLGPIGAILWIKHRWELGITAALFLLQTAISLYDAIKNYCLERQLRSKVEVLTRQVEEERRKSEQCRQRNEAQSARVRALREEKKRGAKEGGEVGKAGGRAGSYPSLQVQVTPKFEKLIVKASLTASWNIDGVVGPGVALSGWYLSFVDGIGKECKKKPLDATSGDTKCTLEAHVGTNGGNKASASWEIRLFRGQELMAAAPKRVLVGAALDAPDAEEWTAVHHGECDDFCEDPTTRQIALTLTCSSFVFAPEVRVMTNIRKKVGGEFLRMIDRKNWETRQEFELAENNTEHVFNTAEGKLEGAGRAVHDLMVFRHMVAVFRCDVSLCMWAKYESIPDPLACRKGAQPAARQ